MPAHRDDTAFAMAGVGDPFYECPLPPATDIAIRVSTIGFKDKGVGFRSLAEDIDTTTLTGRLVFHVFGPIAAFDASGSRNEHGKVLRTRGSVGELVVVPVPLHQRLSAFG